MSERTVRDGTPASPGIVIGHARLLLWERPKVPHQTLAPEEVEPQIERFRQALEVTGRRIREIQVETAERLGRVEAQIFEPQLMMLQDADLVSDVEAYISENRISAARALELRVLEFQSQWRQTGHPMVLDRLNDLVDIETRMIRELLGIGDPEGALHGIDRPMILIARDLTPSITVQLEPERVLGLATDAGTRTSHSAILARALGIPAVVGLGDLSTRVDSGDEMVLDGRAGRVIIHPTDQERRVYRERDIQVREWEQELVLLAHLDPITPDRQPVQLRANIDMPSEARTAREHGAAGIGLFRTEFLVVGRRALPEEETQYQAYREVAEAFPQHAVVIRSFDLGGDKVPLFLNMPAEENPMLGWRAIRLCLDMPELFRTHVRAMLRATVHGDVRIMLPLISDSWELKRSRKILEEEEDRLNADGIPFNPGYKLGVMIETPAAALLAPELARYADFFSIGSNDLTQYTLAVDRNNARLAARFTPFHPAVVELLRRTADAGRHAGLEVSVCGEMAANPLGVYLLLGLGITAFSVAPSSLPEIKKVIRSIPATDARECVEEALRAPDTETITAILSEGISQWLDLSLFSGRWNLSPRE
ncbi:MAG TPA: phosphoenolpyruvate--protein phosphotransferase [Longimicrobiales bacterium]|nr:phosphoenolpyruvate--protein phosphotransferase [Longimicrobiales bacterium]